MTELVTYIRDRRIAMNMSTRRLSEAIGVSTGYISGLERGLIKQPSYEIAKKIFTVLKIDYSMLDYFGLIPASVREQLEQHGEEEVNHREELRKLYAEELVRRLDRMEIEQIEGLMTLMDKYRDITDKIIAIDTQKANSTEGDEAISLIRNIVEFAYGKYLDADFEK